jgi:predicted nucleic acid-binding protein
MIVSNSSPLIALTQIEMLWLLPTLFEQVFIPSAVAYETARSVPAFPWLNIRPLTNPVNEHVVRAGLGRGESEALSLALELDRATVILDERAARRLAGELGIPVTGTLGILLEARRRGTIVSLRPHLNALRDARFYLTPSLVRELLSEVGEA